MERRVCFTSRAELTKFHASCPFSIEGILSPRLICLDRTNNAHVRVCVIFNPSARGEKAKKFRRHLDEIRRGCELKPTQAPEHARRLAAEAVRDGFETVIAAGGDGTLNEVLNGIGDVPDGFDKTRLGVLPLGTVNVFARELGIPLRIDLAWQTILKQKESIIDIPQVEFSGVAKLQRRYFAQLAGAGLDALAIELVHWPLKKRLGPLAYVVAGVNALLRSQSKITVTDSQHTMSGELVLIGNGRLYGGNFAVFPEADLRDRLLEICVFPRVNWLTLARCGPSLLFRRTIPPKATLNFRTASVTLTSASRVPFELDGELAGHLPATFSISNSRLRVLAPLSRTVGFVSFDAGSRSNDVRGESQRGICRKTGPDRPL